MASGLEWATACATSAAALAAAWAAWQATRSTSAAAELVRIERERWEREREASRHADLVPVFERHGPDDLRLVVRNRGPAEARNVRLRVETDSADMIFALDEVFPVPRLPAGADEYVSIRAIPGSGMLYEIDLAWQDDAGEHDEHFRLTR